jgi:hypothetical protein
VRKQRRYDDYIISAFDGEFLVLEITTGIPIATNDLYVKNYHKAMMSDDKDAWKKD